MIGITTLARPYALAAFESAQEQHALSDWEAMLVAAAEIAKDPVVSRLMSGPELSTKQLAALFGDVLSGMLDPQKRNFINLLAEHKRYPLLPGIVELFQKYRAATEKTLSVKVSSAVPLDEVFQEKLIAALTKRLKQQISLECNIDSSLIGGLMVYVNDLDLVIDGSVQGQLNQLLTSLSN